jgi:3-dehydroquinate synthase II
MLLIKAEIKTKDGVREGQVFLQNAETIRVVTPEGEPVSVVKVKPGDKLLVRTDQAGRHFGMRITEEIKEG